MTTLITWWVIFGLQITFSIQAICTKIHFNQQQQQNTQRQFSRAQIFDRIRATDPNQLDKIKVVKGDVSVDGLDISDNDRRRLSETVTVVFHCAANVRFDQAIEGAVNMNTLGTNRVLKLAEQMEKLKVFEHVSTAYCQCNEEILEERAYAAPHSPLGIASMTQLLDPDILEYLTPK